MNPYFIGIIAMGLSWLVRQRFQSVMNTLSKQQLQKGFTGKEVAESMLHAYGINDVKVVSVGGMLTDHYNPANKTVNLSEAVYQQRNITAAAVAAHECGHAVQHATAYKFLKFRSSLVPVVSLTSKFSSWVLLAGIALIQTFPAVLLIGIAMLGAATLFSIITLPVEFDASKRALAWLDDSQLTNANEHEAASKGLRWAAMTYVVAALSSLGTLLYYLSIFMRNRN
ncbi:MAG: zinc metallopeptidase [Bacteroidia bacterium]|nr:zinc metallopeptidase [Bacteroidia bacterium]